MKRVFLLALGIAIAVPISAQSATGMSAEQYYVGSWSCVGGDTGQKPTNARLTYTIDSNLMHNRVVVPPSGKMTQPYVLNILTTYDGKHGRFVQTGLDNGAVSWTSYAKPFDGTTETWTDQFNTSGKLGRSVTERVNHSTFTITNYDLNGTKPTFKATCNRS